MKGVQAIPVAMKEMSLPKFKQPLSAKQPRSLQEEIAALFSIGQNRSQLIYKFLWVGLIGLYLLWPLTHLETYGWSNDEGLYLQRAALANAGYSLYSEAAFNKPPLLIWLLQLAFKIGGETLITGRLTILSLTLIGFVATGKVAQQLWGRWAGLFTVGLLLALPEIPVRAHVVTSDLPAISFTLIALWAALAFRCNGRLSYLILASLTATAGFLIHPLLVYMAAPLGLVLLWPTPDLPVCSHNRPLTKKQLALFGGSAALFVLLVLAAIEWRTFFQWVFTYNVEIAQSEPTFNINWGWIVTTLSEYWTLGWLAIVGTLVLATTPRRKNLLVIFVWFLAAVIIFLFWSPLWEHYRLFLAYPLIIVAGGGLATLCQQWLQQTSTRQLGFISLTLLSLAGLLLFGIIRWQSTKPYLVKSDRQWTSDHLAARAFLTGETPTDAFIATDDPMLAFAANRLVSPILTGATLKRINAGFITLGDAIESTLSSEAPIVLFATGRLERLHGFEEWVTAVADSRTDFGSIRAYRLNWPFGPSQSFLTQLGEGLSLRGFTLAEDSIEPGDSLALTLFWQRNGPVAQDYHVFIHIVDDKDQIVAQFDSPPIAQDYPTHTWEDNLLLPDPYRVEIGPDVAPGSYRLVVGMYEWPSLVRLSAFKPDGSRWANDLILLSEVTISAN